MMILSCAGKASARAWDAADEVTYAERMEDINAGDPLDPRYRITREEIGIMLGWGSSFGYDTLAQGGWPAECHRWR
jgi:hypothetical protein